MKDQNKTKKQLINELVELHHKITELTEESVSLVRTSAIDREQTEEALQEVSKKHKELEHIVNHSPAIVFLWRAAEGWPVEFVSDNVRQFGYTPEDFYSGRIPFANIVYPDDLERVATEVTKYSQEGRKDFTQEYRIITKSGDVRWLDDRTWVRRDPKGVITHYQGIVLDITEHKQVEKALRESEERYKTLFQAGSDAIFLIDQKTGQIVDANTVASKIYGYSYEEFIRLMNTDVSAEPKETAKATREPKDYIPLRYHKKKDGTIFPVEITASTVDLQEHTYILCAIRDITKQKQAEKLQSSLYRIAEVAIRDISLNELYHCIHNIVGELMNANNFFIALYDPQKDLIKRPYFIDEVDKDTGPFKPTKTLTQHVIKTGKPLFINSEKRKQLIKQGIVKPTGHPSKIWLGVPLKSKTETFGAIVVQNYSDVNAYTEREKDVLIFVSDQIATAIERKQAEKVLQESEKRYRQLWDNAPVAYHVLNTKGIITDVNQTEAKMLGYTPEEMVGKFIFEFILPEQRAEARKRFRKKISNQHIPRAEDRIYVKKDSSKIHVAIDDVLERDSKGEVIGIKTTLVDITERMRAEEALRESEYKFRILSEEITEGVAVTFDGKHHWVNKAFSEIFGYTKQELIGKGVDFLVVPEEVPILLERMKARLAGKDAPAQYETIAKCKDGRRINIEVSAKVIYFENKQALQIVVRDITERKQAEEALRDNEAKFRALLESAPDAIVIISTEGNLELVNTQTENMFGYAREELLGKSVEFLLPERFRKAHAEYRTNYNSTPFTRLMGTGFDLFGLRKNGEEFPVEVSLSPVETRDGALVVSIIRDITKRKQAEKKIENLNRMYATLGGVNGALIHIHGMEKFFEEVCKVAIEKGKFRMVWIGLLDEAKKLVKPIASGGYVKGYLDKIRISTRNVAIGKGPTGKCIREGKIIVNPNTEENPDIKPWKEAMLERGYRSSCSIPIKVRERVIGALNLYSDEPYYFDEEEMNLAEELAEDISFGLSHIQAEEALRDSELKFRSVVEQSNDGIYVLQGTRFVFINPRFTEITGYKLEEISGDDFDYRQLVAVNGKKVLEDREAMRKLGEEPSSRYEYEGLRKDGRKIDLDVSVTYLDWGGVPATMGIVRDVSERIRARKKLEEALEQAKQANKVKTLFLANMSHEIRTPLNAILGFSDLVKQNTQHLLGLEEQTFFETIESSGKRLMHTVHEILDISQIEAGAFPLNLKPFYLSELVEKLVAEFKPMAWEKRLELDYHTTVRNTCIKADSYCISQALSGLIENAIKYTKKGRVDISLNRRGNKLLLIIKDTGIGISDEYQEHLFELFSQESMGYNKKFQGVGLGLALAKHYLDMNHVGIDVNSTKNIGTTFTVTFEAHEKIPTIKTIESAQQVIVKTKEDFSKKPLVLVVEDDLNSQKLVALFLKQYFNTCFAVSVEEAKEVFKTEPIELVLLDLSLIGDKDGLDLVRYLRKTKKWKELPIIATTAHAFETDLENCLAAGCNDYLSKPIKQQDLLKIIKRFV